MNIIQNKQVKMNVNSILKIHLNKLNIAQVNRLNQSIHAVAPI